MNIYLLPSCLSSKNTTVPPSGADRQWYSSPQQDASEPSTSSTQDAVTNPLGVTKNLNETRHIASVVQVIIINRWRCLYLPFPIFLGLSPACSVCRYLSENAPLAFSAPIVYINHISH